MFKRVFFTMAMLLSSGNASAAIEGLGVVSDDVAQAIMCEENISISDHMRRMGSIIRELTGSVQAVFSGDSQEMNKASVIENAQMLRIHLSSVFPLTPPKIMAIDAENPQGSKLVFQSYLLRMMQLTLKLEEALLMNPEDTLGQDLQQIQVNSYIAEIYTTVEKAHELFRH